MLDLTTPTRLTLSILALVAFVGVGFLVYSIRVPDSPEEEWSRFQDPNRRVAEDATADPLILAGEDVVPIVLKQLDKRELRRRRYAIFALGEIGDSRATKALSRIASDPVEPAHVRCDALEALVRMGTIEQTGIDTSGLDCVLVDVDELDDGHIPELPEEYGRSYFEAFLGWHD